MTSSVSWRLLILSGLLMLVWYAVTPRLTPDAPDFSQDWDHHHYIAMTQDRPAAAPFAYRILTPLLARVLPFDLVTNFSLITFIALWLTGAALYAMLRAFRCAPLLALIGSVMFYGLYYAVGFNLNDFWLCDPLTFLIVTLAIRAAKLQQTRPFMLLLALGALNKESTLAVIPVWYAFNPDWRKLWVVIPATLIFVGLRVLIQPAPLATAAPDMATIIQRRLAAPPLLALKTYTWGPFGVLCLLPFLTRRNLVHLQHFGLFILLVYAQLVVAINTERLIVLAFPAVILMSVESINQLIRRLVRGTYAND